MKFTKEKFERAFIELLGQERIPHVLGQDIQRNPGEVLIKKDLKSYLLKKIQSR